MTSGIDETPGAKIDPLRGDGGEWVAEPTTRTAKAATFFQRGGVAAFTVLIILSITGSVIWPKFHTGDNARNLLLGNSYIGIVAIGMTFVIITGGIDLSVGSVFALGGVAGVYANNHGGVFVAVLVTLAVCGAVGLLNGILVGFAGLAPFIVTLATLFGVRGLVYQLTNAGSTTYQVRPHSTFAHLGTGKWFTIGTPVFIAALLFVVAHIVLERTRYGLAVQSIGGSESAASLMGLKVRRTKVSIYVLSAMLAGIAGMLQAAGLTSASPIIATGYELQAIAAVVIGGTLLTGGSGSLLGTAAGVLLLGVNYSIIVELQLKTDWNNVVTGAFLIAVVIVQRVLNRTRTT